MSNEKATARFRISTHDNGYYCVSIPMYEGGEVVRAADYDALLEEVGRLREALKGGVGVIANERARHFAVEGWTPEHDDHHTDQSLAQAAACYAWPPMRPIEVKNAWPWQSWEWKPELHAIDADENELVEARIRVLAKAGALIAAEIDRLHRSRCIKRKGRR